MNIKKTVLLSIIGLTVLAGTVSARANTRSTGYNTPSVSRGQSSSQNYGYNNQNNTNRQTANRSQLYCTEDCENLVDGEPLSLQMRGGDLPAGYVLQDDGTVLNTKTGESYTLKYYGTGNTQSQGKNRR